MPNPVSSLGPIEPQVIAILKDLTVDWELDSQEEITSSTHLMADLAFESLDIVQLVVAIEKKFGRQGLPFPELFMREGDYVDDLTVGELVRFLEVHLSQGEA